MRVTKSMIRTALAVGALLGPASARANVRLIYSDLLPNVSAHITGNETGGTPVDLPSRGPSIGASEAGFSVGAGFSFKGGLYPDPAVEVSLSPFLPSGATSARFGAEAEVDYYFSVRQGALGTAQPTFIPVDIDGSFTGGDPQEVTNAGIYVYGGDSLPIAQAVESDTYVAGQINGFSLTIDALPFNVYEVRILASGAACVAAIPIETCAATESTYNGQTYRSGIDPIVTVDPSVADTGDFVLSLSAGLAPSAAPVPEASTWAMLLAGFGALALWGAGRDAHAKLGSARMFRRASA